MAEANTICNVEVFSRKKVGNVSPTDFIYNFELSLKLNLR